MHCSVTRVVTCKSKKDLEGAPQYELCKSRMVTRSSLGLKEKIKSKSRKLWMAVQRTLAKSEDNKSQITYYKSHPTTPVLQVCEHVPQCSWVWVQDHRALFGLAAQGAGEYFYPWSLAWHTMPRAQIMVRSVRIPIQHKNILNLQKQLFHWQPSSQEPG